ncbi:hypothetical protein ACHAWC_003925 [Mediolabrus comicus]
MKLSLILFFIAGAAATQNRSAEQTGSLRRALAPGWSCEKQNDSLIEFQAGCPNPAIGKKGKGNDPCEACCECECEEGTLVKAEGKCVPQGDCDGTLGTDCATACACT